MIPPKPVARAEKTSLWQYVRLFRADILSAQPARLYRAWMAEFRTVFFRSYLCNDPELINLILRKRPADFPKSARVGAGLAPLLGRSIFVTNGAEWERQRRIIDPAFESGRLREVFPAILAAARSGAERLAARAGEVVEVEEATSHMAADVIFRTLFSLPIEDRVAAEVFHEFRAHQRSQPLLNLAAFLPLPTWAPRLHRSGTKRTARKIRALIRQLTEARAEAIRTGVAPLDLATKIMTTADPVTGTALDTEETIDQIAIFFLAGHETSASALAWALYLLALCPDVQDRVAAEAKTLEENPTLSDIYDLSFTKDVFRETLRLYPPVPMMVRESRCPVTFRGRDLAPGAQVILSSWHLQRHERLWDRPDEFDPDRWRTVEGRTSARVAYLPFSAGPRVCPGAGFAMIEGPLLLAVLLRDWRFAIADDTPPIPVAHLTVRSRDGIRLRLLPR